MNKGFWCFLVALMAQSQLASADELNCFGTAYGAVKGTAIKSEIPEALARAHERELYPPAAQDRIRSQDKPLSRMPPELLQIQRGAVQSWVGAFINSGLASYSGIDLDRKVFIAIQRRSRRIADKPQRDFGEPKFDAYDNTTFARKFSNEQFVQMEVVSTRRFFATDQALLAAFACIANAIWRSDEKLDRGPMLLPRRSDTLEESSFLYDREEAHEKWFSYRKPYDVDGPLSVVLKQFATTRYEWPSK